MHDWGEFEVWEERRKEMMEEAERRRLVRELRGAEHHGGRREWRLEATPSLEGRREVPAGGWRRVLALLGVLGVPFFGAFTARK